MNDKTQTDAILLDLSKRRAASFVCNDFSRRSSVTAMLQSLGWTSLERRRMETKATMMYRIVNDLIAIPFKPYLQSAIHSSHKFVQPVTRIDCYKNSFSPSAVRIWNSIPFQHHRQLQSCCGFPWSHQGLGLQCF